MRDGNKPIIFFEQLLPQYKWVIKWHFFRRRKVYFLRLNSISNEDTWIKRHISNGYLKRVKLDFMLAKFPGLFYDMAFDNVHNFFKTLKEDVMVKRINGLYDTNTINATFTKSLNERLARFYYLNYLMSHFKRRYCNNNVIFSPSKYLEFKRTDGCEIYDYQRFYKLAWKIKADVFDTSGIRFSEYRRMMSCLSALARKTHTIFKILGFLLWLYKITLVNKLKSSSYKNSYKYAVMILTRRRQFEDKTQKVDFLIDHKHITKNNTIFLAYRKLSRKNKAYMERNGLTYTDNLDRFISMKHVGHVSSYYFSLLSSVIRGNNLILEVTLLLIYYYTKWQSFSEHIRIENLITYNDFSLQVISRNIILKQHNSKTYYYVQTPNLPFLYFRKDLPLMHRHGFFAFLCYDYFISPDEKTSEYFKNCCFDFKFCRNEGFFWAEHLRLIKEGVIKSDFKEELRQQGYKEGMKLITIFDSNFHHEEGSVYGYQDGIEFLNDILRLLGDLPFVFVVLKEKKSRERYKQKIGIYNKISKIYNILERHPRCYCLQGVKSVAEIIAFNDLTISFPFSSTALEALSARKKAFWYDVAGKFKDTFYDSIPGLVCHSYEEFKAKAYELLYNMTEEAYNEYLDKFIKGKIEPYLDGKAITRFRELLTKTENSLEAQYGKR